MDGSFVPKTLPTGLEAIKRVTTSFADVRLLVRGWAAAQGYFPCTTTVTATNVVVSHYDEQSGCHQIEIPVLPAIAAMFLKEFTADNGVW